MMSVVTMTMVMMSVATMSGGVLHDDDGHDDVGGPDVADCADDVGGHDGTYYCDGGDDDVFFRSQVSRRQLPRRRLGPRKKRVRGSGTPEAVTRPRQRPRQGLGSARNERPSVRGAAAEPRRAVRKAWWATLSP